MERAVLILLSLLLLGHLSQAQDGSDEKCSSVCEDSDLNLICPDNDLVSVTSAMYGRQETETCPSFFAWKIKTPDTDCKSNRSVSTVEDLCRGQNSCSVEASNDVFGGDPCRGTSKYIQVCYKCIPSVTSQQRIEDLERQINKLGQEVDEAKKDGQEEASKLSEKLNLAEDALEKEKRSNKELKEKLQLILAEDALEKKEVSENDFLNKGAMSQKNELKEELQKEKESGKDALKNEREEASELRENLTLAEEAPEQEKDCCGELIAGFGCPAGEKDIDCCGKLMALFGCSAVEK